jgi:hypothetical protein
MAPPKSLISLRCSVRRVATCHVKSVSRAAGALDLVQAAGYSSFDNSYEVRMQLAALS